MSHKHAYRHSPFWQSEEFFTDSDNFFEALLNDLEQAQSSIDIDYYIFNDDFLGIKIINALKQAAQKGVTVRIIIDGIGCLTTALPIITLIKDSHIQLHIFHPSPFALRLYHWSNNHGTFLHKFFTFLTHINHRNHHKLCIIDKHRLFTGSMNISAQHLSHKNGGEGWHDYGVRVIDKNLTPINNMFDALFHDKYSSSKLSYLQKLRNTFSAKNRRLSNSLLVRNISQAKQRIWICNAYFAPSYKILRAIKKARKNAIDVRIILPSYSDIIFMPLLSRSYYKKLLKQGVIIYEYLPSILHAKLLLIDDLCMIGSTNLNHRSFHHDQELDIILSQAPTIKIIETQLLEDIKVSKKILLQDLNNGLFKLLFSRFLYALRYWL